MWHNQFQSLPMFQSWVRLILTYKIDHVTNIWSSHTIVYISLSISRRYEICLFQYLSSEFVEYIFDNRMEWHGLSINESTFTNVDFFSTLCYVILPQEYLSVSCGKNMDFKDVFCLGMSFILSREDNKFWIVRETLFCLQL